MNQENPIVTFMFVRNSHDHYEDGGQKKRHPSSRLVVKTMSVTKEYYEDRQDYLDKRMLPEAGELSLLATAHGKCLIASSHASLYGKGTVIETRYHEITENGFNPEPYHIGRPVAKPALSPNIYN